MVAFVIRIDRLEIKISGISEETVRQTIPRFHKEMSVQALEVVRNNKDLEIKVPNSDTDKLNAGNLYLHQKDIQPSQLGKTMANKILDSIVRVGEESL